MKKKNPSKLIARVFLVTLVFIILSGLIVFFGVTSGTSLNPSAITSPTAKAEVFDMYNNQIEYTSKVLKYTEFADISPNIIRAFVALEDKRFYSHNGIDYLRTVKASLNNIKVGYFKEGGSTITQQLAKNTLLSNEKSIKRKMKEAKLAYQIEKKFSKEEILTMYLNAIYFGDGIYGITGACQEIFSKKPSEVTLAEGAMLAGIVKNPYENSPISSPENALKRKDLVLEVMKKEEAITEAEYNEAKNYTYIPLEREKQSYSYSSCVFEEGAKLLGITEREFISGDYKIYTYQDSKLQNTLDKAWKSRAYEVENGDYLALVADNKTGGVSAYSASFSNSIFKLRRQPGSVIKPIVAYAPALNSGYISPATPVLDEKTDFNGYKPSNYAGSYQGWTNVRSAVTKSSNVVAVKVLNEIGVDYGKYMARQMGLSFESQDSLGIALGGMTKGVTMLEITEAYMTLANYGKHSDLSFIREIRSSDNKVLYKRKNNDTIMRRQVLSPESCYLMTDMLIDTVKLGTARKLSSLPFQIASKTGTVGDSKKNTDAWNLSYTTENTMCVWYGNLYPKNGSMSKDITGGGYPTMLASHIYSAISKAPPEDFVVPSKITKVKIDKYATKKEHRLLLASQNTPEEYITEEVFDRGYLPNDVSTVFEGVISSDLKIAIQSGNGSISMSAKPGFIYKLYKVEDGKERLLATFDKGEYFEYEDTQTDFGFNTYYVEAYTTDGVKCGKSIAARVFSFKLF